MEGIDVFYHIGEIKNISRSSAEKNVKVMEQIVANLAAKGIRRFVFISSITVAGIPSAIPAHEETVPSTVLHDHYTDYKRSCEKIIRDNVKVCEFAIIRPAPVYGTGSRYLGKMVKTIRMFGSIGLPFIGNAKNIAPLVHVQDLATAIVLAGVQQAAAGQTFNLTDGTNHTWLDFFSAVGGAAGKNVRVFAISPLFLKLSALPFDLLFGFLGIHLDPVNYLEYFSSDLFFANTKARSLLDWKPAHTLADGVKEMVAYYTSR